MILVTKPFLPPQHEYTAYVDAIWERNWLTNNGPLVRDLESKLKDYLKSSGLLFLTNGTIAIQLAIKALGIKGEVITTPFSYVATTSSLVWEGCIPIMADIHPETLTIDPVKIEEAITPNTTAILATHVYGNPCDIEAIEVIAKRHNLYVIYDAAHCFGSQYKGKSVFAYGDISTASFHSTKLFHTIEGGAVFANDDLLKKLAFMRNFGHSGPERFAEVGINGKNSEFHAAMGLCNLKYIDEILAKREKQHELYTHLLKSHVTRPHIVKHSKPNYAYYPVLFETEKQLIRTLEALNKEDIFPRRYFYPSLSGLSYVANAATPVCEDVAARVLCLPLYHSLTDEEIETVARVINNT